jgi:hypothetical protein
MRFLFALALAAMLSGCLCTGGRTNGPGQDTTTAENTQDTVAPNAPEPSSEPTTSTIPSPQVNCSKFYYYIDRDICWSARAAQLKDPSFCKRIVQPDVERICTGVLQSGECTSITNNGMRIICESALKNTPSRCEGLNHKDVSVCYLVVAIYQGDTAICDKARDSDDKAFCFALIGSCSQLTDEDDISLCHDKVMKTLYTRT